MKHYSNGNFTLFHAFSYLSGKKNVFDIEYSDEIIEEQITQNQYYALGNINLSEGTNFSFGFHYIYEKLGGQ